MDGKFSGIPQIIPLPTPSACRLLPGIEINKEFTEFFNDPKRERLNLVGFVLGAILVGAVSGLTQSS